MLVECLQGRSFDLRNIGPLYYYIGYCVEGNLLVEHSLTNYRSLRPLFICIYFVFTNAYSLIIYRTHL